MVQGNNKFLFDLNNFDEPDPELIEEEQAPTFTEEDIKAAQEAGYREGKVDGVKEEQESRDQKIADLLAQIQQSMQSLIAAENIRDQQYEEESVQLLHAALKKLLPAMNKKHGLQEIEAVIEEVLKTQASTGKLLVTVNSANKADVEEMLQHKTKSDDDDAQEPKAPRYKVLADDELDDGSCVLTWEDGGAVRDAQKLIDDMILDVEKLLPEKPSDSVADPKDDIKEDDDVHEEASQDEDNPDGDDE